MALSTTQSIWRSGGGDQTRTAYCGSGVMAAQFYVPATNAAGDKVQVSSTNTANLIMPADAVLLSIVTIGDGGAAETFDMGLESLDGATAVTDAFAKTALADAGATIQRGSATAGANLGEMIPIGMSYITAGGVLTAGFSGWITYFVKDPIDGQQNV